MAPCSHHIIHTSAALFTARVHTSLTLFTLVFTLTFHTLATANLISVALGRPRLAPKCILCTWKLSRARRGGHITCSYGRSDTLVLPPTSSTSVSHLHIRIREWFSPLGLVLAFLAYARTPARTLRKLSSQSRKHEHVSGATHEGRFRRSIGPQGIRPRSPLIRDKMINYDSYVNTNKKFISK